MSDCGIIDAVATKVQRLLLRYGKSDIEFMCIIRVTRADDNYDHGNNHGEDMLNPKEQDKSSPPPPQRGRLIGRYACRLAQQPADRPEAGNQHDPNAITVATSRRRRRSKKLVRATDTANCERD